MPLAAAINYTFPLRRANSTELVGFHVTGIGRKDVQSVDRSSKYCTPHSRCHVFESPDSPSFFTVFTGYPVI